MTRRRKGLVLALAVAAAAAIIAWLLPTPLDTRYNGAYRLDDGRLVLIIARDGKNLRYEMLSGESRMLWARGGRSYESGPGWRDREPVSLRLTFAVGADGRPVGFTWARLGEPVVHATRLALPEIPFTFERDGLRFRGRLVSPLGPPPYPAVVIAHGSEEDSAVDRYYEPYLFASMGIAAAVFDKRGTGGSEGRYTQNFVTLARDLEAAVGWVRSRPEIDPDRIHLAGYSQGGWVAPLAAARGGHIRSLLINYGPMVPVFDEDRWGYVYALRQKGFGEQDLREADRINRTLALIVDRRENRWSDLGHQLASAREAAWFNAIKGSDSVLGFVAQSPMPLWTVRLYAWWKLDFLRREPFCDRLYDPVPTLASLRKTPSLWIFGGRDQSMPSEWSLEKLEDLRSQGLPIQTRLFPDADHGILRVELTPNADRRVLGYEPGYFMTQVNWLREQSGLPTTAPTSLR